MTDKPVPEAHIDTNIIIRFLTSDDLKKQKATAELFEKVSNDALIVYAPDTVIADAVYVLSSPRLYSLDRARIRDILAPLINLSCFKIDNKKGVLRALDIYAENAIDFGDAMLISAVETAKNNTLYSYDYDFDRFPHILRKEPNVLSESTTGK